MKIKKVIIDICGDIINISLTDEELKQIEKYPGILSIEISKLHEGERKTYLLEFLRYFYYKEARISTIKYILNWKDFIWKKNSI